MLRSRRHAPRHDRALAPLALVTAALGLACAGCAGPPIAAPIDDIPVCPDFVTGNTKMEGALKYPVRLRVLDGKTVLYRTILAGRREGDALASDAPRTFIADDNARYTVEWAQCNNPHAPSAAGARSPNARTMRTRGREDEASAYECGEVTIYKPDGVLETKKGNPASHVIKFEPPPNPSCWVGDAPLRDGGTKASSGSPVDVGAEPDAGAQARGDAGDGNVADGGAASAMADAGAR